MKYATVCSGIEAPTVAWEPLEWEPAFFSEIEKFPCAVLQHHYPNVPNFGDMTYFKEWPDATIDVICGGTPCQSFSIAGLRKGLDDPRGNLCLTYLAIVDRYRPVWMVWENVAGVLSSNKGRDFGTFIGALGKLGYGFAYRILDAQFFGVPQRRRRVFVVGHLGDWRRAAAVLFERHSLQGHSAPRGKERQEVTGTLSARTSGGGGLGTDFECNGGLIAHTLNAKGGSGRMDGESETFITHTLRGEGFDASEDGTGRGTPIIPILEAGARTGKSTDDQRAGIGIGSPGDPMFTLQSGKQHAIAQTLTSSWHKSNGASAGNNAGIMNPVIQKSMVRRLTPRECCRLQQLPDDYLDIKYADPEEAHAAQILHILWRKAGAKRTPIETPNLSENREDFICEKPGIVVALLSPEILLAGVHVGWLQWPQAERYAEHQNIAHVGQAGWTVGFVRGLREAGQTGCSPYRRESYEQLARELGIPLPQLPLEATQARAHLRSCKLWKKAQRAWPLRYAFATEKERCSGNPITPDGPRYKAIGNSMAVPVVRWIGERIMAVEQITCAD